MHRRQWRGLHDEDLRSRRLWESDRQPAGAFSVFSCSFYDLCLVAFSALQCLLAGYGLGFKGLRPEVCASVKSVDEGLETAEARGGDCCERHLRTRKQEQSRVSFLSLSRHVYVYVDRTYAYSTYLYIYVYAHAWGDPTSGFCMSPLL